jgi:MFS family permease
MDGQRRFSEAFQALWVGSAVSNLGDGLRTVALPLLATTLTDSPLAISLVLSFQFLPWLLIGPFGGTLVDRWDRRQTVLVVQLLRATLMAVLTIAVAFGSASLWQIYLVAFLITAGEILVDPSILATIPNVVDDDDLEAANGRMLATHTVADDLIGTPLGGALFAVAPWLPFAIDSASYAVSTERFRFLPTRTATERPTTRIRDDIVEGFRFLVGHQLLRRLTTAFALLNFGTMGVFGLLVVLVVNELGASEFAFGLVAAAGSVGALVGSLAAARLAKLPQGLLLTGCSLLNALCYAALSQASSAWVAGLFWFLAFVPAAVIMPIGLSIQQRVTPNELLGRVNVSGRMLTRGGIVAGATTFGYVAEQIGVRSALLASAVVVAAVSPLLLWALGRNGPESPPTEVDGLPGTENVADA